jgi:hypothetical protein
MDDLLPARAIGGGLLEGVGTDVGNQALGMGNGLFVITGFWIVVDQNLTLMGLHR